MSNSPKPHIFLVSGAGLVPEHYEHLISLLEQAGFETSCPVLPSSSSYRRPDTGLRVDAEDIGFHLKHLVDDGKEVIVLGHSYGGTVATEIVEDRLVFSTRTLSGLPGGVVRIVYMSAFLPLPGESIMSALGSQLPPWQIFPHVSGVLCMRHVLAADLVQNNGTAEMENPGFIFFNDLPEEEQKHWTSLLVPFSISMDLECVTNAGYLKVPSTFIVNEKDSCYTADTQVYMIQCARQLGAQITEVRIDASEYSVHHTFMIPPA
jgi:pimeloyl-ACP methyl ester carboxylesterase